MPAKKTTSKVAAKKTAASAPPKKAPARKVAKPATKKAAKPATKKVAKPAAKKAAKPAERPATGKSFASHDAVAHAAYLNYRRRMDLGLPGDHDTDWLEAERSTRG
jgi:hypothetical protein